MKLDYLSKYHTLWVKDMPDNALKAFWEGLQKGNVAQITFYDKMMESGDEFCLWARQNNKTLRFIVVKDFKKKDLKTITKENVNEFLRAMYWLNNQVGKCFMIHFAYLKDAFYEQLDIGKYVVHGLLKTKDKNDDFVIDGLLGLTPYMYRHALKFIEKLGFCFMGIVPNACFFERKNIYKNAVMTLLTRDTLMN